MPLAILNKNGGISPEMAIFYILRRQKICYCLSYFVISASAGRFWGLIFSGKPDFRRKNGLSRDGGTAFSGRISRKIGAFWRRFQGLQRPQGS
jgi:hypothetical protein